MDRERFSPLVLLAISAFFAVWAVVLRLTPGGSGQLEWLQLVIALATGTFAVIAYRAANSLYSRRCRYILLAYAVAGLIIVLGLAADQNSSRTWARMGWAALLTGYVGSIIVWFREPRFRTTTIVLAAGGLLGIVGGLGLTVNCDPVIQNTWCDPLFEREQALVEQVVVDGDLVRSGRAGGTQGAALMAYLVGPSDDIESITNPPGEWTYEAKPLQSNEDERGLYFTDSEEWSDCQLNVKIESPPTGRVETVLASCGFAP